MSFSAYMRKEVTHRAAEGSSGLQPRLNRLSEGVDSTAEARLGLAHTLVLRRARAS